MAVLWNTDYLEPPSPDILDCIFLRPCSAEWSRVEINTGVFNSLYASHDHIARHRALVALRAAPQISIRLFMRPLSSTSVFGTLITHPSSRCRTLPSAAVDVSIGSSRVGHCRRSAFRAGVGISGPVFEFRQEPARCVFRVNPDDCDVQRWVWTVRGSRAEIYEHGFATMSDEL
ncbi:hypothetical protein FB451DRAFT_1413675 [Mycena latifolia]|nr:hypothetical protein FB451DRAFT_1413675 [Mycena latifolia]